MNRVYLVFLLLGLVGCDGSSPTHHDGGPRTDAPAQTPDSGHADAGPVALHGCGDADFVDRSEGTEDSRMIMVPRGTTRFDFPCMTIRAGQAVMFMWDFASHPLAPGVAPGRTGSGTEPSPIEARTSGTLYTPTFATPGDYPFHCTFHHESDMVGVVRVLP